MDDDATPELRKTPKVRAYITAEAQATVCYLRLHPSVAKTYGIKVDGNTSVGSMLMQTLCAQGAGVDWHDRLPDGAHGKDKNANQKWSAYIKRIYTRPGGRKKRLDERPEVAPPDNSAMLRHHGRLPKLSFPMLVRLAKYRRPKKTTACGNKVSRSRTPPPNLLPPSSPPSLTLGLKPALTRKQVVAPMPVVLAERDCITQYIERHLRCGCGKRLRFSKPGSQQVRSAVLPSWLSPGPALTRHRLHSGRRVCIVVLRVREVLRAPAASHVIAYAWR